MATKLQQQPPQNTATMHPVQSVPQTTFPNNHDQVRQIPAVRYFSVATLVMAVLWCMMGIVAIVVEAKDSYVGDPIWSSVVFLLPTGIIGLVTYWRKNSICLKVTYFIMSIITCTVCFQLLIYASLNAREDDFLSRFYGKRCLPWPGFSYISSELVEECQFSGGGRLAVNVIICLLTFTQMVLTIVSLPFIGYATFKCCYNCCRPPLPPAVIQYTAQDGSCQLVSVGGYNSQPVMVVQQTPTTGQDVQIVSPVVNVPGEQTNPVHITAGTPPGANMQQQTVNITPASHGGPTIMTMGSAAVSTDDEKPSKPSAELPDSTLSYGKTASGDFHDEKKLI